MSKKQKPKGQGSARTLGPSDVNFKELRTAMKGVEKDLQAVQPLAKSPVKIAKIGDILDLIAALDKATRCQKTMVITFN